MGRGYVLIWGDTGRLGSILVDEMLLLGYAVVGISRRKKAEERSNYLHIPGDITDSLESRMAEAVHTHGIPKAVINTTAAFVGKPISQVSDDDIAQLLETNIVAPARLMRILFSLYEKSGLSENTLHNRSILQISSAGMHPAVLLRDPRPIALYGGSKAAQSVFMLGVGKEFFPLGVRVNVVAPTYFSDNPEKTTRIAKTCTSLIEGHDHGKLFQ